MSLFIPVQACCSNCGTKTEAQVAASVNADRRPDLRVAILDGSFQAMACPNCDTRMRLPAHMTYIDVDRGQWILLEDAEKIGQWDQIESETAELYGESFGASAPPLQRKIGEGVSPRLVFGWAALREKLIAQEAGLDDVTLELFKISVVRNVPAPPLADMTELRLIDTEDDTLTLRWLNAFNEEGIADLPLERAMYEAFAADTSAWNALRADISGGLFVDMKRILFTPASATVGEMMA